MTPQLETVRLLLRPLELADAAQTQRLFPCWEIVRHLNASVPWPYPPDGAFTFYRDVLLPGMANGTEWHWTLRLKAAPEEQIGGIGLSSNKEDNRGFWLGQKWQGQRLMTEAAIAVTDFWFDVLGFERLRTKKAAANAASIRISEQTGMRKVGTTAHDFVSGRLPAEIWEISREEWFAWRQHDRSHH